MIIPLSVEPNSVLTVEQWAGESLLSTEQFNISDSTFSYRVAPFQGDRRIKFSLRDRYNNISAEEVTVSRGKVRTRPLIVRPERPEVIAEKRAEAISELERAAKEESAEKASPAGDQQTQGTIQKEAEGKKGRLWYLWLIAGAGLLFILIILFRRKKKDKEKE